jgi:subtilisin-like proprotein convertase family protein
MRRVDLTSRFTRRRLAVVSLAMVAILSIIGISYHQTTKASGPSKAVTGTHVEIAVMPGEAAKTIDLGSTGDIAVAVLGSPTFDAATVDATSLRFAGATVLKAKATLRATESNDVRAISGPAGLRSSLTDVNKDGRPDLVAYFAIPYLSELSSGYQNATLSGRTRDGAVIEGWQAVKAAGVSVLKQAPAPQQPAGGPPSFCNANPITINDNAAGSPYPSTINVTGLTGVISNLTVSLTGFSHTFAQDASVLLVGPSGQKMVLFAQASDGSASTNVNLLFDDAATAYLPIDAAIVSGTFKPTNRIGQNIFGAANFPAPAPTATPASPYAATLSSFKNTNPNGTWSLYVVDNAAGDSGTIAGGWCLNISTAATVMPCTATLLQGAIAAGDTTQTGRLFRDGVPSECVGTAKTCPGPSGTATLRFDKYTLTNQNASPACVTVTPTSTCGLNMFAAAYLTSYTPPPPSGNLCTNYLGDNGLSPQSTNGLGQSFSFTVPAGATFVLVVNEITANTPCASYSLLVEGDICAPASCMLTCAANITQTNDPDQCGAVITYPAPTTTGSCGTITCSPASGSFFPVGTTTVTCTSSTGPSCSFTVTITDDQPPTITCPANITKSNDPNQCGAVVNYPSPTITDNCPGTFTATCTPASGSFFPVGTTTVTCTVNGFDEQAPLPSKPANSLKVATKSAPAKGVTPQRLGVPVTSFHRNIKPGAVSFPKASLALLYDQTDNPSAAATSSQNFEASFDPFDDAVADDFIVPAGEIWTINQVNVSGVYFNGAGPANSVNVTFYPDAATLPGSAEYTASNLAVVDTAGNFVINLTTPAMIPAGTHWVSVQANMDFGVGGQWGWLDRTTISNSGAAWINPGGGFGAGCSPNFGRKTTCVAGSDPDNIFQLLGTSAPAGGGNGPTCTFTITVNDTQAPVITCPANITVATANVNSPCQVVTFAPTASDNCPGVTVVCTPASGTCFPVGVTTVSCTATDASNNTASCSFTVSVFNGRLEDDAEGCNNSVLFNTLTGDYRWCCHGTVFTGKGKVTRSGNTYTLQHNPADRRVLITLNAGASTPNGNGSLQSPPGTLRCTIADRDIRNDTCLCGAAPPPTSPNQ